MSDIDWDRRTRAQLDGEWFDVIRFSEDHTLVWLSQTPDRVCFCPVYLIT